MRHGVGRGSTWLICASEQSESESGRLVASTMDSGLVVGSISMLHSPSDPRELSRDWPKSPLTCVTSSSFPVEPSTGANITMSDALVIARLNC